MTPDQEKKCHAIIHTAAISAGAGNLIPVPGTGIAMDVIAMTAMASGLAAVFGGSIAEEVAKSMAITAIKNTMLKQPIKVVAKELGKLIPWFGEVFAASVSIGIIEAAGWVLAKEMAAKSVPLKVVHPQAQAA